MREHRISAVDNVKVTNVQFASIISVGDTIRIEPRAIVFAVQRELPQFLGTEGNNLSKYPLFTRPIPLPPIDEQIDIRFDNSESPFIKVTNINLLSIAASAVFHIGASETVDAVARVKHIRQLLPPRGDGAGAAEISSSGPSPTDDDS